MLDWILITSLPMLILALCVLWDTKKDLDSSRESAAYYIEENQRLTAMLEDLLEEKNED
ncbi:hypothetical protein OAD36_03665 [Gammaproteobacteria bacterium]|nr:hypothetical protein [Gammaproteobacteria bacterium]